LEEIATFKFNKKVQFSPQKKKKHGLTKSEDVLYFCCVCIMVLLKLNTQTLSGIIVGTDTT